MERKIQRGIRKRKTNEFRTGIFKKKNKRT